MKRKLPLLLLCLLFLGIGVFFGFRFFRERAEYRAGEQMYASLTQYVQPASQPAVSLPEPEAVPEETAELPREPEADPISWPEVDFGALQALNPDVSAWVIIEGTAINYPVVQGADNSFYLNHLFDGTYNRAGSIFLDFRNRNDFTDRNTVLYGHHMKNQTMFAQITLYKDQSYYDQHPTGMLLTPHGNYTIYFFAGYVTDMNSQAWKLQFESDEEFAQWLEEAAAGSTFSGDITPTAQDRVVTFSTCTYEYDDARYVLVGVLR